MKFTPFFTVVISTLFFASMAQAATSEDSGSATSSDLSGQSSVSKDTLLKNKKFEDTKVLTDPNLRASDGSLSRYSFKGSLAYSGPTLGDLSAQNQPNPDKTVGNFAQKITGNVNLSYRLDPRRSFSSGIGVIMSYPFAGDSNAQTLLEKSHSGSSQYSANNPFVSYNIASRWDTLQMRNSFMAIDSTQPVYTSLGETGGVNYYNGLVYGLGLSRVSLSLDTSIYYWIFNRGYNPAIRSQGGDAGAGSIQQYTIGLTPGVKYNFTESLNVYTNMGFGWQNPRDNTGDLSVLQPRSPTVALGLGWAYQREIYIAPYITTYPLSPSEGVNETTVNLTTTFSLL
jgi:hypothetical protein